MQGNTGAGLQGNTGNSTEYTGIHWYSREYLTTL